MHHSTMIPYPQMDLQEKPISRYTNPFYRVYAICNYTCFKGNLYLRISYSQVYFSFGSMKWLKPFFYPVSRKNILSLSSAHMVSTLCYYWMVAEMLSSIVCLSTTDHKSVSNDLTLKFKSYLLPLLYPNQII